MTTRRSQRPSGSMEVDSPSQNPALPSSTSVPTVPTSNRFAVLATSAASNASQQNNKSSTISPSKPKYSSPLVVYRTDRIDQDGLVKLTQQRMGNSDYIIQLIRNGIRIKAVNIQLLNSLRSEFQERHYPHYTYDPDSRNRIKYVIKGLPSNTKPEAIQAELLAREIGVLQIRQITKLTPSLFEPEKSFPKALPLYVITILRQKDQITLLKAQTGLFHFRIHIEDYKSRSDVLQCFKCQNFGHKANFCSLQPRCVQCAGDHNTKACTIPKDTPPVCALCGGAHCANSRECPRAITHREKLATQRSQQTNILPSQKAFPPLKVKLDPKQDTPQPKPTVQSSESSVPLSDETCWNEIYNFLSSGSLSAYIRKIKQVLVLIREQSTPIGKFLVFCQGLMDIFDIPPSSQTP